MAIVWIPAAIRSLANGKHKIIISGRTLGEIVDALEHLYPGIQDRLNRDPALAVSVNGKIMQQIVPSVKIEEHCEIHFIPAISGG